jgi:hypothetical protein
MNENFSAIPPLSLQEEFAGVVPRRCTEPVEVVESLRGRMSEAGRQVKGSFESVLFERFSS